MDCKDIQIRKSEFVAKSQFLSFNDTIFKGLPQKWEFWDDCTFTKTLKLFLFCAIYQNIRRLQDSNIDKAAILYG